MTTEIMETIIHIHEDLLQKFDAFIADYHAMSNDERMTAFTDLSGEFNKILEVEWNTLFPLLDRADQIAALRDGAKEKRDELVRVYELLVMIHVNEPEDLFHQRLVEVRRLLEDYHQALKTVLFAPSLVLDEERLATLKQAFNKAFYTAPV